MRTNPSDHSLEFKLVKKTGFLTELNIPKYVSSNKCYVNYFDRDLNPVKRVQLSVISYHVMIVMFPK